MYREISAIITDCLLSRSFVTKFLASVLDKVYYRDFEFRYFCLTKKKKKIIISYFTCTVDE